MLGQVVNSWCYISVQGPLGRGFQGPGVKGVPLRDLCSSGSSRDGCEVVAQRLQLLDELGDL